MKYFTNIKDYEVKHLFVARKDPELRRKIISSLKNGETQESKIQENKGIAWSTLKSILDEELCGAVKKDNHIYFVESPDGILIKEEREKRDFWKLIIIEDDIETKLNQNQIQNLIRKTIKFFREGSLKEYQKLMDSEFGVRVIEFISKELSAIANQDIVWDLALKKLEGWNVKLTYYRDFSERCPNCGKVEFQEEEAGDQLKVRCKSCGQETYTNRSWNDPHPKEDDVKKVIAKNLQEFKDNRYPTGVFLNTVKHSPDCLFFILDILEGKLDEKNLQFYCGRGKDLSTDNVTILLDFEDLFILKPPTGEAIESHNKGGDEKRRIFLHVSLHEVYESLVEGLSDIKSDGLLEELVKCFRTDSTDGQTTNDVGPLGESTVIIKPESSSEEVKSTFERIKTLLRKGDTESVLELLNSIKFRAEIDNKGSLATPAGCLDHFINYTTIYSAILGFALQDENIDKYFLHELKASWKHLIAVFNYFDNSEEFSIRPANKDEWLNDEREPPSPEDIIEGKLSIYKNKIERGEGDES